MRRIFVCQAVAILAAASLTLMTAWVAGAQQTEDSGTMARADKEMAAVLQKLKDLGAKPLGTQSVEDTRKGPTPADAVKAVLKDEGKPAPAEGVDKKDMTYPTGGGSQPIRIYTPAGSSHEPLPIIVYYHGGGWVIADINTYESSAIALAKRINAIVASVEYRHAPENKFPAAHEDAYAAYLWVLQNAKAIGGDGNRVALAGESAGGNLAINVAIMARDKKAPMPLHMLLVYPVAGTDMSTPSYQKNAEAVPLSKKAMAWFFTNTIRTDADKQSPLLDVVERANLTGLPSATVITAEIDPLMSEGQALATKLAKAGVATKYQNYDGVTHEFFGMDAVVSTAVTAQTFVATELNDAFTAKR